MLTSNESSLVTAQKSYFIIIVRAFLYILLYQYNMYQYHERKEMLFLCTALLSVLRLSYNIIPFDSKIIPKKVI